MARTKAKTVPSGTNYLELWEKNLKPEILKYYNVPIDLASKALGVSVGTIQSQLRSEQYNYGIARKCDGGCFRYEILPLRFINYIEGRI